MRRTLWIVSLAAVFVLLTIWFYKPSQAPAKPAVAEAAEAPLAQPAKPQALLIARAVLFSSGVGYFQREGEVQGSAKINLSFPVGDINDLLKSMVLRDLDGGHVSAVSYDSHDPIDKTLKSFAVNLTNNPTFSQILLQARGEKVEATLRQSNHTQAGTLTGVIVGIEMKPQWQAMEELNDEGKAEAAKKIEKLNLWAADGLHSLRLEDVKQLRFLNPVMQSEMQKALNTLASSHDIQKKAVSLTFTGDGKRRVRVGYVVENPIWKTSYRLVLDQKGKAFLQGWAIVENPGDEDWSNVRMTLVSGRPISFLMDLYEPLYVRRPVVEPELFASLRPPTYEGPIVGTGKPVAIGIGGGSFAGMPAPSPYPVAKKVAKDKGAEESKKTDEKLSLAQGVASAASAAQLGDFFQYVIDNPVTLARQKSAMLPIVNQNVEGSRVSIYNQNVHPKFPMLGLKFKNTTGLHLMQGPITVFDGSSYAGDARILDLQPKEERLLSYAVDLGTEVEPVVPNPSQRMIKVVIHKGILYSTTKIHEGKKYNIKNRSDQERMVLIEHPYRAEYHLVSEVKPGERTREVYRFALEVPGGKSAHLEVAEERDLVQQYYLTNIDDQTLRYYINSVVSGDRVKEALKRAIDLKDKLSTTQRELAQLQNQLQSINQDQTRLRENLKAMPQSAAAYRRYLEKFDQQESDIEKLQDRIKTWQELENKQRKAYEEYVAGLDVE